MKITLDVAYSIFDVSYNEIEDKRKVLGLPDSLRQSSHYVSDGIYEYFYGIEGIFTKLMYVTGIGYHKLITVMQMDLMKKSFCRIIQ